MERFCRISQFTNVTAVELSVLIGVGGCGCPRAIKHRRMKITNCALWNKPTVSALAADATILRNILQSVCNGPLWAGLGIPEKGGGLELR